MTRIFVYLFLIIFLFYANSVTAQNKKNVDSLNNIYEKCTEDTLRIKLLIDIAYEYRYSNPDTSLFILENASALSRQNNLLKEIAQTTTESGYVFWVQTRFDSAVSYANKSLKISTEHNYLKITARSYQLLGMCNRDLGNYPAALDYFFKSLQINEQINNKREIANCYNNIGEVYKIQQNYKQSHEYYTKSLVLREEIKDYHGLARIYNNIAELKIAEKNYEEAIAYTFLSLKVCEKINNKLRVAQNYAGIADIYTIKNNHDSALYFYNKALDINKLIKNTKGLAENNYHIALLYKDTKISIIYAEKAYLIASENKILALIYSTSMLLYKNYKKINYTDGSLKMLEIATAAKDSMYSTEKDKKIDQIKFGYEIDKKQKELELAEKDKILAENKTSRQRLFTILFAGAFLFVFLLVIVVFRSRKKLKRAYDLVTKQKNHIQEKNEELNQLNEEITMQKDEISFQKQDIERKTKKITESILYAKRIQNAVLPSESLLNELFTEYFIIFRPRDLVSGDFYFAKKIDDKIFLALADCTGHGVPGAFMSMLGIAILNDLVANYKNYSTGDILQLYRDQIKNALNQTGKLFEAKDGLDIAFCTIDLEQMNLQFSGAHIPIYIIKQKNDEPELVHVLADNMPIGIYVKESEFRTVNIDLEKNDLIYLASDGFTDQTGGQKKQKYMPKRFRTLLTTVSKNNLKEQQDLINKELLNWQGTLEQIDDITIIGIKI